MMKNKIGTIEWQNEMMDEISKKLVKGVQLESYEEVFLEVQAEHNSRKIREVMQR